MKDLRIHLFLWRSQVESPQKIKLTEYEDGVPQEPKFYLTKRGN